MTQYQEKGYFVRKTPSCSWCNGYVLKLLCYWFSVWLSACRLSFCFFSLLFFFFYVFWTNISKFQTGIWSQSLHRNGKRSRTLLGTKVPRSLVASWCLVRFKKLALVPPLFQKEVTTDTPAWHNSNKRVSLSLKQRRFRSLRIMHCGCYAIGFRLDSHLDDLTFFSLLFFRLTCCLYGLVLVQVSIFKLG